jgi:hypothetical protein
MLDVYCSASFGILALVSLSPQQGPQPPALNPQAAFEKEMREHPSDALVIARRAAKTFGEEDKRLNALAVQLQEKNLPQLGFRQVIELAEVMEKKLEDPLAAKRTRISWLRQRGLGLSESEVRELVGPPAHVSYQFLFRSQVEQWKYDSPAALVLQFLSPKGNISRLQTVH